MKLVREGRKVTGLDNIKQLKESKYNISLSFNEKTAVFNTASGSIVVLCNSELIAGALPFDNEILMHNGFIVPAEFDEFSRFTSEIKIAHKGIPSYFTIIPTTACNAKCFYCYEDDYCKQSFNKKTVADVINYLCDNIDPSSKCVLDWFGGEPLLAYHAIDDIIDSLKSKNKLQNNWTSSITTNGTLFSKDLIHHAVKDWNLQSAHLTIDGTEEDHNRRKNVRLYENTAFKRTLECIKELLQSGVYVNLRIHLDRNNRNNFDNILDEISELFSFSNLHLFPTFLFPPESEMPENYITDNEKEDLFYNVFASLLRSGYAVNIEELFPMPKSEGCFATKDNTVVIAPDGSLHSCVQDFTSASVHMNTKYSNYSYALEECKECSYLPICLGGCLYNRNLENTVRTPCVRNRFIIVPLLKLLIERTI
jgi:radical SAM protein with 4Fe4S-binding SPASM domain